MNSKKLSALVFAVIVLLGSLFVIMDVLVSGGNQIGRSLVWLSIIFIALSFAQPKASLTFFLLFCFYADFLKRLLIFGSSVSLNDVATTLVFGPVIVCCICVTCLTRNFNGKAPMYRGVDWFFLLGCSLVSVSGYFAGGGLISNVQSMVGTGVFGTTAYASYCYVREDRSLKKILLALGLAFIPIALYCFWQTQNGIAEWEEDYIKTGLSKVLYNFYSFDGIWMRPFATMNTHTSLGAISGMLAVLFTYFGVFCQGRMSGRLKLFCVLMVLLSLAVCYLSKNRTTYFIPIFFIPIFFLFRGRSTSYFFYLLGITAAVTLVASSRYLMDNIQQIDEFVQNLPIGEKIGSIQTFGPRLSGFNALSEVRNWSLFGLPENAVPYSHDQLSNFVFRYGWGTVFLAFTPVVIVLGWWHYAIHALQDRAARRTLNVLTALLASTAICGLLYGNLLFVNPVNALFGFLAGASLAKLRRAQVEQQLAGAELS